MNTNSPKAYSITYLSKVTEKVVYLGYGGRLVAYNIIFAVGPNGLFLFAVLFKEFLIFVSVSRCSRGSILYSRLTVVV